MAGNDTLGVYGAGDTVIANGTGDGVWIGQNGESVSGAAVDRVIGMTQGTVFVLQDSSVAVVGSNYTATMTGQDRLTALGVGVDVDASGADNALTIGFGGASSAASDIVHMPDGGFINEAGGMNLRVFGDGITLHGAGGGTLEMIGADDRAVFAQSANSYTIGQNGGADQKLDTLVYPYEPLVFPITVLQRSNLRVVGWEANVTLGGRDWLTLVGADERIVDLTGNNHITIGGNGPIFSITGGNRVTLAQGDTVAILANSNLYLSSTGAVTNGQYAVQMSRDDSLEIDPGMTVSVPLAGGDDLLSNFGATDVLRLASHFASVDDLLAHTSVNEHNFAQVQLDGGSDTLTLDMSKSAFAVYAHEGLVKFS